MRLPRTLVPALAVALAVVAVLADRALVGQGQAARAAALARLDEEAEMAAEAVRASLVPLEQAVAGGGTFEGVEIERLSEPPPRTVASAGQVPYRRRPRVELADLLSSTLATPNGLPEAVVARLALGPAAPVSGAGAADAVEERLLSGGLPVRPEDLPYLAERLGIATDPRVGRLAARLREAPDPEHLPVAPAFRRRLTRANRVEGWSRSGGQMLRYEVPVGSVLARAGAGETAAVVPAPAREPSAASPPSRTVAVPDVEGLFLRVRPRLPGSLRIAALRTVLWLSGLSGIAGLVALGRALGREEKAMARERAFLAGVTHELRTPLTTIRVLGETLSEGRGSPREYGALVAQESERLEGLVERVLTLTRVEQRPRFGVVDPIELLRSAVEVVRPRAERHATRIEIGSETPLPECRWDADAVRRAVLNLLDNAVAHGREGGYVRASASTSGDAVRLAVADDGPGIGRTDRRRIFGRFERGATEAPGTGLGLYLVEEVARAHGGRVDLVTGEGRGSTFTLVLPARPDVADAQDRG